MNEAVPMDSDFDFLVNNSSQEAQLKAAIPLHYCDITLIPEEGWAEALRRREIIRPLLEEAI